MQYSPILHIVIRMRSSDHERQLAKITAEVGSTSSSPGVSLHDWLEEESEESLNDNEIDEFVQINRAKNTVKKTESDLQRWRDWCTTIGEKCDILDIPTKELNRFLCHFCKGYQSLWKGVQTRYTDLFSEEHRLISTRKWADTKYYHGQ